MVDSNAKPTPTGAANGNATAETLPDRYACPRCFVSHWVAPAPPGAECSTCNHPSGRMGFWAMDAVGTSDRVSLGVAPQTAAAWRNE